MTKFLTAAFLVAGLFAAVYYSGINVNVVHLGKLTLIGITMPVDTSADDAKQAMPTCGALCRTTDETIDRDPNRVFGR